MTQIEQLRSALGHLLYLHTCEQEGIASGQPTREQWLEAYDAGVKVMQETGGIDPTDGYEWPIPNQE